MSDVVSFRIDVPEQGFDQTYQISEIDKFIEDELAILRTLLPFLQEPIEWQSRSYTSAEGVQAALSRLQTVRASLQKNKLSELEDYVARARRLELVIFQGVLGERIRQLMGADQRAEAKWLFHIFSPFPHTGLELLLSPIRAAVIGSPMFAAYRNVVTADHARKLAQEAQDQSDQTARKIEEFYNEKAKIIGELEELYRKKIPVEEAAAYWERSATAMRTEWWLWFGGFALMALLPVVIALFWWEGIAHAIIKATTAGGSIALGGVAAVTVPAVFYLWFLKNISRVFQQRLALADDAAHRRLLTMTYLGLAKEPRLAITDGDRALILNALFRPVPPSGTDDGPPSGLIDLIRKPST
jgi:hypothetical protein